MQRWKVFTEDEIEFLQRMCNVWDDNLRPDTAEDAIIFERLKRELSIEQDEQSRLATIEERLNK